MALRTIRLELARSTKYPEGDARHGYVLKAPLTAGGSLDREAWANIGDACTVRRFAPNEDDEIGRIVHTRRGWAFSYQPGEEDDEPIFRLDSHVFKVGEYITVTEHDGVQRTFKVVHIA
jgi:hypothetical protein